jgi:hypothetical protein
VPSKKILFQQGVAAASVTFGLEGTYVCPLCQRHFDIVALGRGQLTAEHVPPASRGGKRVILTCRMCNNAAGHGVDAEAARRDEAAQFEEVMRYGKPGKAGRLTLTWGNQPLTIDASVGDDGVTELKVVGNANDPARIKAAHEFMAALSAEGKTDGYTMQGTSFVRFHPRKARISDLRAAYLACCAKLGYRYALHPALDLVRAQIADPDKEILERWWFDKNPRAIKPAITICDLAGVVIVTVAGTTVFLPWPAGTESQYLEHMKRLAAQEQLTLPITCEFPWPVSFEASVDHNWGRMSTTTEGK